MKLFKLFMIFLFSANLLMAQTYSADVAGKCMVCHKEKSHGLYNQWYESAHARNNVTCINCHGAEQTEADAFLHEGAYIATLVTPKDCGTCHEKEAIQVSESYHATAAEILESEDAYLANVAGGHQVAITGCENCHGARVKIDKNSPNKLSRESWPNSGIGRINPDGSKGSCNACHTRHSFSVAQSRQPESCSKCHLGPDHPQKEVYEASKHGNTYYTHKDEMNLESQNWVVGRDYYTAPTCATCHISATDKQALSHDVGRRLHWTLRPPVSKYKENHISRRNNMKDVCRTCHGDVFVNGHFYQFDGLVNLYDEKFAKPATDIINMIREKGLREREADYSNDIDWIYWELWHHEGRRARHGAAMMGPDYTWWHGIYEVAHHFYLKFLPAAREYNDKEVNAYIDKLLEDPIHSWVNESNENLKEAIKSNELQKLYKEYFPKN
ncbi:MAG: hypothetical protein JW995_06035 [Melioribacteraceae bacterium]|nr:hypothetical protein [Melioribacteraceae bacterium]